MNVVIIGCGIIGAAIAYELSQFPNLSITVLEQQSGPAQDSTGAALGVLMGAISQKLKGQNLNMRLLGIQTYNQWIPQLEAMTGRKIPFNQQGILRLCAVGDAMDRWETLISARQRQGWNLQLCDRAFLHEHYPHLNLDQIVAGIYSPSDRQIDPAALTHALVTAAQQRGVCVHFNTSVETLHAHHGTIHVQTADHELQPDWLIVAAGVGSTQLTTDLPIAVDIRPVLGQAVQLKLSRPLVLDPQPVITSGDIHLVPRCPDEYWIGATVEFPEATGKPLPPDDRQLQQVLQQAIALCPALQEATVLHQWYGLRPRPEGRPAPIIEQSPACPNILLATGHYRNGVLLAPATAYKVRQVILGSDHPV